MNCSYNAIDGAQRFSRHNDLIMGTYEMTVDLSKIENLIQKGSWTPVVV